MQPAVIPVLAKRPTSAYSVTLRSKRSNDGNLPRQTPRRVASASFDPGFAFGIDAVFFDITGYRERIAFAPWKCNARSQGFASAAIESSSGRPIPIASVSNLEFGYAAEWPTSTLTPEYRVRLPVPGHVSASPRHIRCVFCSVLLTKFRTHIMYLRE